MLVSWFVVCTELNILLSSLRWQARRESPVNFICFQLTFSNLASAAIYNCDKNAIFPFLRCPKIHFKMGI